MELSRRGFIAAVTSTLATAVPLAAAAKLKPAKLTRADEWTSIGMSHDDMYRKP